MKKFIFILGGAKSGKSGYALKLAKKTARKAVFIATATASDREMKARIRQHKILRPRYWGLVEEPKDIALALTKAQNKYEVALVDCLGLWVSNLLADNMSDKEIKKRIDGLIKVILKIKITTIVVSNEVGSGIVPANPLSRRFRDLIGLANQTAAEKADQVIFMISGIPMKIR